MMLGVKSCKIFISGTLLALVFSCTQYKNAFVNRHFHNVTARFNGYFYAKENIKDGISKIETEYKEDYTKTIPIFIYPTKESAKSTFKEFDKAILKASTCIMHHAIKNKRTKQEIPNTGNWIDDCWMAIGKSKFYKRELFSGIESFDYVQAVYKSKQKHEAWLWLAKSYLELNALTPAQDYLLKIESDGKFPKEYKSNFQAVYADFFLKQNAYSDVIKHLLESIRTTHNRTTKARYYFIIAQLYELLNEEQKARMNFHFCLRLRPAYEMVFYAKIKEALLHDDPANRVRAKKELLAMTKDIKNEDYRDVIYYSLGKMEEKDEDLELAITYYKKSVKFSVSNNVQKARSFLRLADIHFDRELYPAAANYYDSTVSMIKEDFPDYEDIVAKKKSLDQLVTYVQTIKGNDSLMRLANMDSSARQKAISKIINQVYDDEKKAAELKKQSQVGALATGSQIFTPQGPSATDSKWYFYNPTLKTQGLQDFVKRWGQLRTNENNWRRANKGPNLDLGDATDTASARKDTLSGKNGKNGKSDSTIANGKNKHKQEYYLKNIPLQKADQDSMNKRSLDAFYELGSLYREQLNNAGKSAETFETMNNRFPKNKYEAAAYYQMYLIYLAKKSGKAQRCKDILLSEYPNSDYAKIINDPNFTGDLTARKNEIESIYTQTLQDYQGQKYQDAYTKSGDALLRYGKNDFTARFAFIKAVSSGYIYGIDTLEQALRVVTIRYTKSEIFDPAMAMLNAIKKKKHEAGILDTTKTDSNIEAGNYVYKEEAHHAFVLLLDRAMDAEKGKNAISNFNTQNFSPKNLEVISIPKNDKVLITVRTFDDKDDAMGYYNFLTSKSEIFQAIDKRYYHFYVISLDNIGILLKKDNFDEYHAFFNAKYLGIKE